MTRKLVSVVTGTYQRHDLLMEAIENVRAQTYRPLEHVIVSDGPDPKLDVLVNRSRNADWEANGSERCVSIVYAELGFWASGLLTNSISAAPFMVAQLLAHGDLQMWLADDERMLVPDHIEKLVGMIEDYDLDFAYPKVKMTWPDSERTDVIGTSPPQNGQFTHCLYRRDALDRGALFRTHVGSGTDWDCAARMMDSRCRWGFLREVTLSHVVDK